MSAIHVAVSGVTGFIGAHVARDLLAKGYHVHGTVRTNKPERVQHLTSLDLPGTLQIFEADLLKEGSFDAALEGCKYAIHVASPYSVSVKDPQKELVDPAVKGTLSFLNAVKKAGIKKVVLTSSFAAMHSRGIIGKTYTEEDWNTESSLTSKPYYYSKTLAEKAAWDFVEGTDIKLVVINPVAVYGPSLTKSINETVGIVVGVLKGRFPGIVDLGFPSVDVRDVSKAHVLAMESETASGRYLCCPIDNQISVRDITDICNENGFKAPTRDFSSPFFTRLIKLMSYVVPGGSEGETIRSFFGTPAVVSSEKIARDLKIDFIDARTSIKETLFDLVKWGHLPAPTN